jgi:hypothetical protein
VKASSITACTMTYAASARQVGGARRRPDDIDRPAAAALPLVIACKTWGVNFASWRRELTVRGSCSICRNMMDIGTSPHTLAQRPSALDLPSQTTYTQPLVFNEDGVRLAKRHDALSIRAMRRRSQRAFARGGSRRVYTPRRSRRRGTLGR